ncbi:hypothetical protein EJB05_13218, partial [Eragrostis curvula]
MQGQRDRVRSPDMSLYVALDFLVGAAADGCFVPSSMPFLITLSCVALSCLQGTGIQFPWTPVDGKESKKCRHLRGMRRHWHKP